ncbi:MAG: tRNA guanosine(15) transglycosylase TgtA [Candidatus Thermoplasmatota archaeon]|nr:tRNA guanosine(15) transglycosylase TgtA [Euryarchaeota archaeon]MBU4031774.1 tRNA guanosine(15) transglycosylase TgtA [Candidatus Thermoplasmatota archaeon]MBU4070588.1 tRNA guanosine(15) transglycosylase TgtA [Candidatus Thermoplasmatota archaeon]MBU4143768.1 tRNA guanosine(15) transglycosylase TgtA [Candidatus Thermoplasmatota archaeon]MBU4591398.1 tRNA guanosine(15) transglycosylase TgtA [Candidatus Thermoplasmatota archaeon]
MFELKDRDGLARIGILRTAHGDIETPTLLPVINPNQITVSPAEMREKVGMQAMITNSYIIRKSDNLRDIALEKGLHHLVGFDGPIMTDSGTFQAHVYGKIELKPLEIIEFQKTIGSDIGTVLDLFSEPDDGYEKVQNDLTETITRTKMSAENKGNMMLAGPIQGGRFPELREHAAREMSKLDCDVFPVGGVVPMMERQMYSTLVNATLSAKKFLDPSKPVHLFGAGHPMLFALATLMGCDMFDSSAYAKFAREGRMMFSDGTRFLAEMRELPCHCQVCSTHTADELRNSPSKDKLLALHNLHVSFSELRSIKQAIHEGRLWELAETRCRSHPTLLDGLRCMANHTEFLERHEPLSRTLAYLYTSRESYHRPTVTRLRKRILERYEPPNSSAEILLPDATKPYSRTFAEPIANALKISDAHFWADALFCPVPLELDEMYPISQSVVPEFPGQDIIGEKEKVLAQFRDAGKFPSPLRIWNGIETLEGLPPRSGSLPDMNLMRVKAVADIQFGKGAGNALLDGKVKLVLSSNTDRIRNVQVNGNHVLSMRAGDGFFSLKPAGGRMLLKAFPSPKLRVIVNADSAEFNRLGRNVFCGFIVDADPGIIPRDEVIIVNESDELCAIGQAMMTREEMLAFRRGIAVKVRDGVGND